MPYVQEKEVVQLSPEKEAARQEAIKLLDWATQSGAMKQQWSTKYKNQLLSGQRDAEEWMGRWVHDYKIPEPPAGLVDLTKMPNANFSKTPWAHAAQTYVPPPPGVDPGKTVITDVVDYKGHNLAGLTKKETTYIQGHIDAGLAPAKVDAYIQRRLATRGMTQGPAGAVPSPTIQAAQADPLHGQKPSARVVPLPRDLAFANVKDPMTAEGRAWSRKLTSSERSAVGSYTGSSFGPINKALRTAAPSVKPPKAWDELTAADVASFQTHHDTVNKIYGQSASAISSVSHGS